MGCAMSAKLRLVAVAAAGALLVGVTPAVAGQAPGSAMTTVQARKAFLKAVCPLNATLMALDEAESAPNPSWATVQPLLRQAADMQMRAARKLGHPKQPWPANVRKQMPALVEIDFTGAGLNYALAAAGSMEEYEALVKSLQKDFPPAMRDQLEDLAAARKIIRKRLDLPAKDSCELG